MKRIALRYREVYRNAFSDKAASVDSTREHCCESDPRAQVPTTDVEYLPGDERTFERAFADNDSIPGIQYC